MSPWPGCTVRNRSANPPERGRQPRATPVPRAANGFCTDKLGIYRPAIGKVSRKLTDLAGITDKRLFCTILDMLLVFERPA
jgi:hypothetical protein